MDKYNTQKFVVVVVTIVLSVLGGCIGCRKDELDALLQLKSAINDYPNGTALPDWKEEEATGRASDCCGWARVVCDGERGSVAELHLDYVREAEGEWHLNASLFLPFPYLWYLSLRGNSITGWTHHLRQLSSLYVLLLGYNKLEGMIDLYDVEALQNLNGLGLGGNRIDGFKRIHGNNIDGQIPRCLGQMTFQPFQTKSSFQEQGADFLSPLTHVKMHNIRPPDNFEVMFGEYLIFKNKMKITTKSHTYNYEGIDLDGMTSMNLAWNKLSGEIPLEIGSMAGVRAFNLSHNELTNWIPSSLSKLSNIESLDLSYNNLNGSIPSELIKLTALAVFTVAHNNLSGRTPEQKAQFGTFEESSYEGNALLCGPPLLNDCSPSSPSPSRNQNLDDVNDSMDMYTFYTCFSISSAIMFLGTLIVLWINPRWRRMWFYYGEMWISWFITWL